MNSRQRNQTLAAAAILTVALAVAPARGDTPPVSPGISAAIAPLRTVDPSDHDFADLDAFGKSIDGARYVVLGEQKHGEGNVWSLKTRLVEYLHEKMGYDVLIMESGLFDGAEIEQHVERGKSMPSEVPGSIFYMYSGTKDVAPLWDYFDSQRASGHPMILATFDSNLTGRKSAEDLIPSLESELTNAHSGLPATPLWPVFKQLTLSVLRREQTPPDAAAMAGYFKTLDAIDAVFASDRSGQVAPGDKRGVRRDVVSTSDPAFWRRIVAGLRVQASTYWIWKSDWHIGDNARQAVMGDNLKWLLKTVFANKKVIIWCHDGHAGKFLNPGDGVSALQHARSGMPHALFYHVFFTGYDGEYYDFNTGKNAAIAPRSAATLEYALHAAGAPPGFLDLHQRSAAGVDAKAMAHHLTDIDFGQYGLAYYNGVVYDKPRLPQFADGLFYLLHINPSAMK